MPMHGRQRTTCALDQYLDRAMRCAPLTAEEEHAATVELRRLRVELWTEILQPEDRRAETLACIRERFPEAAAALAESLDRGAASLATLAASWAAIDGDRDIVEHVMAHLVSRRRDGAANHLRALRRRSLDARNRFAEPYLRLVVRIASGLGRSRVALEDRVQDGNLGLLKAVDRFDPDRGFRFSTYATWWIRASILRRLIDGGRLVRIPANLHFVFAKARRARDSLRNAHRREPTVDEISAMIGVPAARIEIAEQAMEFRCVGYPREIEDDDPSAGPAELRAHDHDWLMPLDDRRHLCVAEAQWHRLDDRERDVLDRRLGLHGHAPKTLREIGDSVGWSGEWTRRIQVKALAKLRAMVEESPVSSLALQRELEDSRADGRYETAQSG
jgi:RNA polymerase primary sigma factor